MPFKLADNWDVVDVMHTLIALVNDLEERVKALEGQPETREAKEAKIKKITT